MTPPTSTDGTDISAASIDGQEVEKITIDGQTVFESLDPFNISTAALTDIITLSNMDRPQALTFNPDGSKMFVLDGDAKITQLSLSTPYEMSTASNEKVGYTSVTRGIRFNGDGTRIITGNFNDRGYVYDCDSPFDVGNISFAYTYFHYQNSNGGIEFGDNGNKFYECDTDVEKIFEFDLSTPYDPRTKSSVINSKTFDDIYFRGFFINDNGNRLYEIGREKRNIDQFNLSTPFDISTASFANRINGQASSPTAVSFKPDGTELYEMGRGPDKVFQYEVG